MGTVAVVDIGSNSTRLLVAQISDGQVGTEFEREDFIDFLIPRGQHDDGHAAGFPCLTTSPRSRATGPAPGSPC